MSNKSLEIPSINTLPPETLASIFALSKRYCFRDSERNPLELYNLTAVCTEWRQLALGMPNLWTHIDIGPSIPRGLTRLLLGRTKKVEIHVHVYEPQPEVPSDIEDFKYMSRHVIPMLKPHIRRIRTLHIQSFAYSTEFVGSVLNLWLDYGDAQLSRSLFVYRPYFDGLLSVDEPEPGTRVSQSKNSERVLLSVKILHLEGSMLPWSSSAYRDLVELKLQFHRCEVTASMSQLANLFSASPALVILKLAYLTVTRTEGWIQSAPVLLDHLEVLDLVNIEPHSLELLLPLIQLPDSPNDLSVAIPFDKQPQPALEAFFARSQIAT
ncbi:hypothetical protein FRC07_005528, partial [Ceratobasidium sp. 392]